jgi:hypothetical protein
MRLLTLLLGAAYVLFAPAPLSADAASGTYTGSISMRGNYWWERSTRVVAPEVAASVSSPQGVRIDASYLLDAITSASQATGVLSDVSFTERRNEVHAGLGYEVDFGEQQLDVAASGRYSKEPDYLSRGVGFAAGLSLNERNTVLHLSGYFVHDEVYRLERVAASEGSSRLMQRKPVPRGDLDATSIGLAWDQVLNRSSTLTLGYDAAFLYGFQANAYRAVPLTNGPPAAEKHPNDRVRHAGYVWLSHFFARTRTAVRLGYRLYRDTWELLAHATDIRIHQEIGPYVELRLRYRFYTQTGSEFFQPDGYTREDRFYTADPKMTEFRDQTAGLKVRISLDFLDFTSLDVLSTAVLDWSVDYVFENTNRYGTGVMAQGGLGWSF